MYNDGSRNAVSETSMESGSNFSASSPGGSGGRSLNPSVGRGGKGRHLTPDFGVSRRSSVATSVRSEGSATTFSEGGADNRSVVSSAMGADREEMVNERLRSIVSHFRAR